MKFKVKGHGEELVIQVSLSQQKGHVSVVCSNGALTKSVAKIENGRLVLFRAAGMHGLDTDEEGRIRVEKM